MAKNTVILQNILFPEVGVCTERELYFRYNSKVSSLAEEKGILFMQDGKVKFDTYFNGFSMGKWKKYTVLDSLKLNLCIRGKFLVELCSIEKIHKDILKKVLSREVVQCDEKGEVQVEFPQGNGKGMYTFSLKSLDKKAYFYGGCYCTDVEEEKLRKVKIGIDICTFRREAFVEKNIRILKESILENENSLMKDNLEIFISDNGQTLDREKLQTDKVHIFPNRNLGGSGGFTRGLIEINKSKNDNGVTHALLMDDDIVIETESLFKTYRILTMLKDDYADAFIAGAMLRLDKQNIQEESGASWNAGYLNSLKKNLDLNLLDACLYNEFEEYTEFNAWWYCCFPISVVKDDNLPLPIFIRGDDVEYGLRNMKHLVLMNGICVWHEPFENKYSSFLQYYILRNQLIDNSFHFPGYKKKTFYRALVGSCLREMMYYRYKNVDLILRGVNDFYKGPEWLMNQDGEQLHKDIMASGYRGVDIDELDIPFNYPMYENSRINADNKKKKMKRILTFNGMLLKAKGYNVVPMAGARPTNFYRKKRVLNYDITSNKGFITEKSYKEFFRCMGRLIKVSTATLGKFDKAKKVYQTKGPELRTLKFWNHFLGLEEER